MSERSKLAVYNNGQILFGRYRINRLLGEGGSGTVYLATHIKLDSLRAIKCISKQHPMFRDFLREAELLKSMNHPGIPIVYDMEEDEESSYIIEEYIEGDSLEQFLHNSYPISFAAIVAYGIQICEIIEYLHTRKPNAVYYLDLKPSHIIICKSQIKIIDFGTALYNFEKKELIQPVGTPGFAAPEQYNREKIGQETDIYALGAVLYYMVTGMVPVNQKQIYSNLTVCSIGFENLILTCLKQRKNQRFQSITQVKYQLQKFQNKKDTDCQTGQPNTLVVGIAGSKAGIGVTHFSISLVSCLNNMGYFAVYEEKNGQHRMQEMKEGGFLESRDGYVWKYAHFYGVADLGKAVKAKRDGASILVKDFGVLTKEREQEYSQCAVRLAVIGVQPWEERESLTFITKMKGVLIQYLALGNPGLNSLLQEERCPIMEIPYFPDPFKVPNKVQAWMTAGWKKWKGTEQFEKKKKKTWFQNPWGTRG